MEFITYKFCTNNGLLHELTQVNVSLCKFDENLL
jgi:hypothetical protein